MLERFRLADRLRLACNFPVRPALPARLEFFVWEPPTQREISQAASVWCYHECCQGKYAPHFKTRECHRHGRDIQLRRSAVVQFHVIATRRWAWPNRHVRRHTHE